ncbi:MAG: DinB family protein, partial [Candidatus Hodarchaeales archaeon]
MKDHLINAISSGFHGKWTHIDPKKVLEGLNPAKARKTIDNKSHSCWELLHHIVIWQDAIIKQIKGETLDWNKIQKKDNWPTKESTIDDSNFINLVNRFHQGVEEAKKLINHVNFTKTTLLAEGLPEVSIIKLYIVLLQHESYHIGQIITVRKCLGDW